jgi:hypothetical protein
LRFNLRLWPSKVICKHNCVKEPISDSASTAKLKGDVWTNRQIGEKCSLLKGNARGTHKKSTQSQLFEHSSCKFDPPCLFKKKTMVTPIYWPLGQTCYFCQYYWLLRKIGLAKNSQRFASSNVKLPSIATAAATPLIFRYYLPLNIFHDTVKIQRELKFSLVPKLSSCFSSQ